MSDESKDIEDLYPEFVRALMKQDFSLRMANVMKDIPKTKSDWTADTSKMLTADFAQMYMDSLLQAKKEENPDSNYILTDSVALDAGARKDQQTSVEFLVDFLAGQYSKFIEGARSQGKNLVGIYSVVNDQSRVDPRVSHQNWICLDVPSRTLIRFEPSNDYDEFRMRELFSAVAAKLPGGWKYELSKEGMGLNVFSACRVMSTLLAVLNVLDVPLDVTRKMRDKKGVAQRKFVEPFVWLMQEEIKKSQSGSVRQCVGKKTRRDPFPHNFISSSIENSKRFFGFLFNFFGRILGFLFLLGILFFCGILR